VTPIDPSIHSLTMKIFAVQTFARQLDRATSTDAQRSKQSKRTIEAKRLDLVE